MAIILLVCWQLAPAKGAPIADPFMITSVTGKGHLQSVMGPY